MFWYDNRPFWRFSVLLLLIPAIYGVFGWTIALESDAWSQWLIEGLQLERFHLILDSRMAHKILYGLALLLILATTFGLTIMGRPIISLFSSCFRSDVTAIISVLVWSFVLALIICFLNYFAELLLLLGAAILGRLELQEIGYNNWQICALLSAICVGSFAFGLLGFDWWHHTVTFKT